MTMDWTAWIADLDLAAFGEEIRALGKELEKGQGEADAAHLRKVRCEETV